MKDIRDVVDKIIFAIASEIKNQDLTREIMVGTHMATVISESDMFFAVETSCKNGVCMIGNIRHTIDVHVYDQLKWDDLNVYSTEMDLIYDPSIIMDQHDIKTLV